MLNSKMMEISIFLLLSKAISGLQAEIVFV